MFQKNNIRWPIFFIVFVWYVFWRGVMRFSDGGGGIFGLSCLKEKGSRHQDHFLCGIRNGCKYVLHGFVFLYRVISLLTPP